MLKEEVSVSVVIPAHNAEDYIGKCLESVLAQTLSNLQIICVDDGSNDRTSQIIRNFMKIDQRIELYTQKQSYAGVARNLGLKYVKGRYVHFLDADDWLEPDAYEKLAKLLEESGADFIKFKSFAYDEKTSQHVIYNYANISSIKEEKFNKVFSTKGNFQFLTLLPDSPWSGFYKRDFLINNRIYFDEYICVNDTAFFYRCLVNSKKVYISDCKLLHYRINNKNSLVGIRGLHFDCQINAVKSVTKICSVLSETDQVYVLKKMINSLIFWHNKFMDNHYLTVRDKIKIHRITLSYLLSLSCEKLSKRFLKGQIRRLRPPFCFYLLNITQELRALLW